jgi:D-amino-acid dehydrogenase
MKIAVIGGGVVGLCCAYYLRRDGHEVTVIDSGSADSGCSWGNAGMIVPSHLMPMAAPGMISRGIRWMFNASSPFYVRPRLDLDLLRWGLLFYRNSTEEHVRRAAPALCELSLYSKTALKELISSLPADIGYTERGLMMLYQSVHIEREEAETAAIANRHGVEARILGPVDVQASRVLSR